MREKQEKQIYVKNLNFDTREEQIEAVFREAKVGEVKKVTVIRRGQNEGEHAGKSRGYGFVQMDSKESAQKAVKRLQNFMLDDHALKLSLVEKAITEAETT